MEHTLRNFDVELRNLCNSVGRMGDLVVDQLETSLRALSAHDLAAARSSVERDTQVNGKDIEIEEHSLRLLALRQPVASDLRLITAAMKIATELERIGDRAVNICEAIHMQCEPDSAASHQAIARLGERAAAAVRKAVAGFEESSARQARQVIEEDHEFDQLYTAALPQLTAFAATNPQASQHDAKLAFLLKDLNEISEHATNIAELVIFIAEGKQLSHMDMHERRLAK